MDFTREPIIETIISPREGCKLVVRSSKSVGQEEFFVDAVEVVSFGQSFFLRSMEKPKPFLVPASDYEVLEVREARILLKNTSADKSGRPATPKESSQQSSQDQKQEPQKGEKVERKREKRRQTRRGKPKQEVPKAETGSTQEPVSSEGSDEMPKNVQKSISAATNFLSSLLTPPTQLISDTISKYHKDASGDISLESEQEEVHFQRIQNPEPPQKD